jgi:hypothetical protein
VLNLLGASLLNLLYQKKGTLIGFLSWNRDEFSLAGLYMSYIFFGELVTSLNRESLDV